MKNWIYIFIKTIVIFFLTMIIFIPIAKYLLSEMINVIESSHRYLAPSKNEIYFDDIGIYNLFFEYKSVIDGQTYTINEIPTSIVVSIKNKDSIEVYNRLSKNELQYKYNEFAGTSILNFKIDSIGEYVLDIQYKNGDTLPKFPFTFSKTTGFDTIVFYVILLFLFIFLISFFIVNKFYKQLNIKWGKVNL